MNMDTASPIQHIFVDFENTQVTDLKLIHNKPVRVTLIVGEKQKHLPVSLVQQLLQYHTKVRLLETAASGKNALDFILAFHIGQASKLDTNGHFHIVSKDKGFDALIKHLQQQKIIAARHDEFDDIPVLKPKPQQSAPPPSPVVQPTLPATANEQVNFLIERFRKTNTNRPTRRESLLSYIDSSFAKRLKTEAIDGLVQQLIQRNVIGIDPQNKVQYRL